MLWKADYRSFSLNEFTEVGNSQGNGEQSVTAIAVTDCAVLSLLATHRP